MCLLLNICRKPWVFIMFHVVLTCFYGWTWMKMGRPADSPCNPRLRLVIWGMKPWTLTVCRLRRMNPPIAVGKWISNTESSTVWAYAKHPCIHVRHNVHHTVRAQKRRLNNFILCTKIKNKTLLDHDRHKHKLNNTSGVVLSCCQLHTQPGFGGPEPIATTFRCSESFGKPPSIPTILVASNESSSMIIPKSWFLGSWSPIWDYRFFLVLW